MKKRIRWKTILNFSIVLIIILGCLYYQAAINQQKVQVLLMKLEMLSQKK